MHGRIKSGFTLIELLVVIVIIGILASISIPMLTGFKEKARLAKAQSFSRNINTVMSAKHVGADRSLIGAWRFDGGDPNIAIDNSGEGPDLVSNLGNITSLERVTDTPDNSKNAVRVISSGYAYRDPSGSMFNVGSGGGLTLNGWFKVESFDTGTIMYLSANNEYSFRVRSNESIDFAVRTDVGLENLNSGSGTYEIGKWHSVLGTYDESKGVMQIYLDGDLVADKAHSGTIIEFQGTNLANTFGNPLFIDNFQKWAIPYSEN